MALCAPCQNGMSGVDEGCGPVGWHPGVVRSGWASAGIRCRRARVLVAGRTFVLGGELPVCAALSFLLVGRSLMLAGQLFMLSALSFLLTTLSLILGHLSFMLGRLSFMLGRLSFILGAQHKR